jgi:HlyD family secretion protein
MRRIAVVLAVLVVGLSALLALRLRAQGAAARAPAGGSGEIEATEVHLSARITARIERVHVREGDEVKRGQPLVDLDCADPRAALAEAEARLAVARAQASTARAGIEAAHRSRAAATVQGDAARAQARALAAERDAAERQAARTDALADDLSAAARDQARAGADAAARRTDAAEAQARASGEAARAAAAAERVAAAQAAGADASVVAAAAAVDRARLLADECRVVAPLDAVVETLPHEPGELVSAGATLVELLDLSEVRAIFYLPNADVGAARPGARAEVVADAFPGERFEGRVVTVSAHAEFTPRNVQTRADRDRLVYPVEVVLANPDRRLRDGMPVQISLPGTGR